MAIINYYFYLLYYDIIYIFLLLFMLFMELLRFTPERGFFYCIGVLNKLTIYYYITILLL